MGQRIPQTISSRYLTADQLRWLLVRLFGAGNFAAEVRSRINHPRPPFPPHDGYSGEMGGL